MGALHSAWNEYASPGAASKTAYCHSVQQTDEEESYNLPLSMLGVTPSVIGPGVIHMLYGSLSTL